MKLLLSFFLVTTIWGKDHVQYQTLKVKGLVCSFCAQGIEKKLKSDHRIESVKVDLKKKEVIVELKPHQTILESEYNRLLNEAGYTLEGIVSP